MSDEFLSLTELSKYLKIPRSTLYKLSQTGRFPSVKIGKQLRFKKSSIDNWVAEKEGSLKEEIKGKGIKKAKNILLIEDDLLVLSSLTKFLGSHGFNLELAKNSAEALEKTKKKTFDLVICDVRLPGVDGIETIKRIRAYLQKRHQPKVPEIIITGYLDRNAEERAQKLGIADFIYKPFLTTEFINTVRNKLEV